MPGTRQKKAASTCPARRRSPTARTITLHFSETVLRKNSAYMSMVVLDGSAALKKVATGPLENLDDEADDFYLGSIRRCSVGDVGCDGTLVNQLSGRLDDAIYWERVVSGGEIAAIHAAGPNGLTTDKTAPASTASAPATASVGPIPVGVTAADAPGPTPRVHDPSGLSGVDLYVQGPGQSGFTKAASAPGSGAGAAPAPAQRLLGHTRSRPSRRMRRGTSSRCRRARMQPRR